MDNTILIVDDDTVVLEMLEKVVRSINFEAVKVQSGEKALELLSKNSFSLLLLDINLQGIDGFQVIERLRSQKSSIPIIVVSGRTEDFDTLYGLEIGADDYITKPFNPITLSAKIKALLRRSSIGSYEKEVNLIAGPFTYNTTTFRLYKNEVEIPLTGKENILMKLFMENINTVFSKGMLYDLVWGDTPVYDNSIIVYVNRLRQKIEDNPEKPFHIQNIRGVGYRFVV